MYYASIENSFDSWRKMARDLVGAGVCPENICWNGDDRGNLFAEENISLTKQRTVNIPSQFISIAKLAACFDEPEDPNEKWAVLYRVLFRLAYENKNLLNIESDRDVRKILLMRKAVARDIHKFHAFVRFRQIECEDGEIYVAWHEPHHFSVELSVPFFVRRFGSMHWSILTPRGCAHWDRQELTFSGPALRSQAPLADITEDNWLTYYSSIFNPFRLKVKMMKKEMPVRHWQTLPEARLIPDLIRQAKMSD